MRNRSNNFQSKSAQFVQGSAILSALFIMTLIAIAVTAMSIRLQLDTFRTQHVLLSDKLYLASQAVTYWALSELSQKKQNYLVGKEHGKVLLFPRQLERIYPHMQVKGELYDLQARFNLNNLSDKEYHRGFLILLDKLNTQLNDVQKKALLQAIVRWITPPKLEEGQEEWVKFYTKNHYLPAQHELTHFSEFRLIQFVSAKIYLALSNFISVLPPITPINLNTAPPSVLATLGMGLKPNQVKELIEARNKKNGISEMQEIMPLLQKFRVPKNQVTLQSRYFLSVAIVTTNDLSLTTYALLKRNIDPKGTISVTLLRENLNSNG